MIGLDPDALADQAKELGVTVEAARTAPAVLEQIQQHIDAMNEKLARVEQVKKFRVLPRNLSVDDGELTATLKIKRAKVAEHFSDLIEEIYAEDE